MAPDLFDWAEDQTRSAEATGRAVVRRRAEMGAVNYCRGDAAEDSVAAAYCRRGAVLLCRRWRGAAGEIDLILRDGDTVVFVEVKAGRSFDAAIARIRPPQVARIAAAAAEFLGSQPLGQLTEVRFDAGLVDGCGQVRIVEQAFGMG